MLSFQFPIPAAINTSFSSHTMKKKLFFSSVSAETTNKKYFSHHLKPRLERGSICAAARTGKYKNDQIQLPEGLEAELMPKHVAIIMDGNRRWAENRRLPVQLGYRAGAKAMKEMAANCRKFGVRVLTVFAFSTENWTRQKGEIGFLMKLGEETIRSEIEELMRNDMRFTFVGNRHQLPQSLQDLISFLEEHSKDNQGLHQVTALNYGGRYDITEATKRIVKKVKDGVLKAEDIDEALFERHLETEGVEFPNPDLLIRTSGELRVSNFMLWQMAYTEMFFVDKLFPDFGEADFVEALTTFQRRQRRYSGHKY